MMLLMTSRFMGMCNIMMMMIMVMLMMTSRFMGVCNGQYVSVHVLSAERDGFLRFWFENCLVDFDCNDDIIILFGHPYIKPPWWCEYYGHRNPFYVECQSQINLPEQNNGSHKTSGLKPNTTAKRQQGRCCSSKCLFFCLKVETFLPIVSPPSSYKKVQVTQSLQSLPSKSSSSSTNGFQLRCISSSGWAAGKDWNIIAINIQHPLSKQVGSHIWYFLLLFSFWSCVSQHSSSFRFFCTLNLVGICFVFKNPFRFFDNN